VTSHFINLSGGLAWTDPPACCGFVRIQSTACEQKRWGFILAELDYSLLAALAAGVECHIYDVGARKPISRALWQGVPWILYALHRRWLGTEIRATVGRSDRHQHNVTAYFRDAYATIPRRDFARLDYFDGCRPQRITISPHCFPLHGHNPSAADLQTFSRDDGPNGGVEWRVEQRKCGKGERPHATIRIEVQK